MEVALVALLAAFMVAVVGSLWATYWRAFNKSNRAERVTGLRARRTPPVSHFSDPFFLGVTFAAMSGFVAAGATATPNPSLVVGTTLVVGFVVWAIASGLRRGR